jgi:molecular chaperone GrpE
MAGETDGVTNSDSETEVPGEESVEARLSAQVLELEARLRTVSAAYKQKSDEIEATKGRLERNAAVREEVRRGEIVAALFEPVENLHRSIQPLVGVAPEAAQGLTMIHQQFHAALRGLGLEEVGAVGEKFDPALHEAITSQPTDDPGQDGVILNVFSVGYRNGRQLIRPARVIISVLRAN